MPEGPSIVILREQAAHFVGRRVDAVSGNSRLDIQRMRGQRVRALRSWGKHFLICFGDARSSRAMSPWALRVHFMLFGSYHIDERREATPRLSLQFRNGELSFYACSLKYIEGDLDAVYDWSADVMAPEWNPVAARRKLLKQPDALACDVLLDQDVFAGCGNIIKNEVLHRIRMHPESTLGALPSRKRGDLVREARDYSFDFYEWKKARVLRKHWQVHAKTHCPRDGTRLTFRAKLGRRQRRAFYCERCQRLYV